MLRSSGSTPGMAHTTAFRRVLHHPLRNRLMYSLYAEDTSRKGSVQRIKALRSKRFSRAMREAEAEPTMQGCRYFIAERDETGQPDMTSAAYLGVSHKPAPVGSQDNQAHQRKTLRDQVSNARKIDWDSKNEQGETLGEVYVDMIRKDLKP